MSSASGELRVLLDVTAFRVLESLAGASAPVSGRAVARMLGVSPTTALAALGELGKAGYAATVAGGRSSLWYLNEASPTIRRWLDETRGAAPRGEDISRPRRTAVIFTALPVEYAAVVAHLPGRQSAWIRATRFEKAAFAGIHVDWTVHVAEVGAGNVRTGIEMTSAVGALDPDFVLFAGIAGSVKPADLSRGDVVVADRVYNLHSGKDTWDEGRGSVHLGRPVSFPAAHRMVQLAKAVRQMDWTSEFAAGALNVNGDRPRVEVRPIAAGEVVHADERSPLMVKLREQLSDVAAVEMESLGLYEAAQVEEVPALAVRGISDCVGDKEPDSDREWQPRAAQHAAAFALALLRHAEPDAFPRLAASPVPNAGLPARSGAPAAQLLLRLPPPVAAVYGWAQRRAGDQVGLLLEELAALDGRPATWLSRFRHRPLAMFRAEDSQALWVLVAQFADSFQHPVASWLYEQAASRSEDGALSACLLSRAAVAATRDNDMGRAGELLKRAEDAAPAGQPLWSYFRAALGTDVPAFAAATLAIASPLDLDFGRPVVAALGGPKPVTGPDEDFASFIDELAERHPELLEQTRLTVTLATAAVLQRMPGQLSPAQVVLEGLTVGLPAYREAWAGPSASGALAAARSSNILVELARTLCMKAADPSYREMGFDRDALLTRAEDLALTARDRLLDWGGPTGDALAVAAQARAAAGDARGALHRLLDSGGPTGDALAVAAQAQAASGDARGALRRLLPPPAGTAGDTEAASQRVVRVAAELAVGTGNIQLALELAAKIDEPVERRLATALALSLRADSHPQAAAQYREALSEPAGTLQLDQQIRSLLGLSLVTELTADEISRVEELDQEIADLIRAQSFLTAGKVSQAQVLARRYPSSDGALQIRVGCLLSQGRTSDAVDALETYASRHGDERFVLQAAMLALSVGADDDASRLAGRIASSNDPYRRRVGREILIETASRREDWQAVLIEARRLLSDDDAADADPAWDASRAKYRWAQAHAFHQLRRMGDAYDVIRADPRLIPADLNQARLLASILRTIAPSIIGNNEQDAKAAGGITQAEVLRAVTQVARAFPHDEELVATAVMTAFALPSADPPDFSLMTEARQLHQQFLDSFPDSQLITAVPAGKDLTGLVEFLRTHLAPSAEAATHLQRRAMLGQIPISVCAAAFGRSYAEALIRNEVGCYVVRHPDERVWAQEVDAARRALDSAVVADVSALFLAPVALGTVTELRARFEQILLPAPQRDDILQARASLMMRSSGWLGWDPASGRPTFIRYDDETTERWASQASALAAALEWCDIAPDPPSGDPDPRHRVWSSAIRLARERQLSLIADDAALRAGARGEGVLAFGSLHVLAALIADGVLPDSALAEGYQRLMAMRAAELPVLGQIHDIAKNEQWNPAGYAAFLFQRPGTWIPLADGWRRYTSLISALPEKKPGNVAAWCASAISGISLTAAPASVPAAAAALIAWTLLELQDPAALPALLALGGQVVAQFTPDADLLGEVVHRLVATARLVTPPDMLGTAVLPLLSGLDKEAHAAAIQRFFTMP